MQSHPKGVTVRLPKDLGTRIDRLVDLPEEGLVSRNAWVVEVVRHAIEEAEEQVMRRGAFASWLEDRKKSPIRHR